MSARNGDRARFQKRPQTQAAAPAAHSGAEGRRAREGGSETRRAGLLMTVDPGGTTCWTGS